MPLSDIQMSPENLQEQGLHHFPEQNIPIIDYLIQEEIHPNV